MSVYVLSMLWAEHAGFAFDIANKFPKETTRRQFLAEYVRTTAALGGEGATTGVVNSEDAESEVFLNGLDVRIKRIDLMSGQAYLFNRCAACVCRIL